MSLPSGYKRLEYIESSGTQYIDTSVIPTNNTKIEVKGAGSFYASINGTYRYGLYLVGPSNRIDIAFGSTGYKSSVITAVEFPAVVSMENGVVTANGKTATFATQSAFTCSGTLPLFVEGSVGALYSCKIYDNGTLVRDYIPVQRVDGTVGLLDQANFVFYPDAAGVGFVAGPVIPDAPGNFRQTSQDYFEIGLAWDASEGATGYNLYKDGALIYTGTDLSYLDTQGYPGTSYVYQVTAFSAEGEGDPATLEASTKAGWAVIEPVFLAASISPNPVDINQSILISVQLTDAVRILEAETFYSGELYAGEV